MKIFKYTSLNAAIGILKSGGVGLSNPIDFNDPNDCSFEQDEKDKIKIEKLVTDYFMFKVASELAAKNQVVLKRSDRLLLSNLQKEINFMKRLLGKRPFFTRIPGFDLITKMLCLKSPKANSLVNQNKKQFKDKVDAAVKKTKESALISCFSKRKNSILMWSHYARGHKGVCIEYTRPKSIDFKDVKYQNKRPYIKMYQAVSHVIALDILGKTETPEETTSYLKDTLRPFFIKSKDWTYEKEVRCLYSSAKLSDNIDFDGNRYVADIGLPKAIYIGCRAAGEELDHLIRLAENRGIPVFFMKKSEKTFDIVVDKEYKYVPAFRKPNKEITLLRLINDINSCLDSGIYLAAFAASLIIPAICSQVEIGNTKDKKERYIKWCNEYLPCTDYDRESPKISHLTGEVIWNIKEKLFSEGNINVFGKYDDFEISKIVLRIEQRNKFDFYTDLWGEGDVTTNITKFCSDMIYAAKRCYKKHQKSVDKLTQITIQDFDAELESMHECAIATERINGRLKG